MEGPTCIYIYKYIYMYKRIRKKKSSIIFWGLQNII